MKSIFTLFLSSGLFCFTAISQTFTWSGTYGGSGTNRTYTTTVSGVTMSATIVNSENTWQNSSPCWFPTGSTVPGGGCSGITATNQGMLLSTDWTTNATKTITTTITFSTPVQGPVNFKLFDVNDDGFGSWLDKIIITGTNSMAAPVNVFKVGTACVQTGGSVTGSGTPTLTFNSGTSSACTCWGNNEINVGNSSDCISTITIQYKSGNTTYNNPQQYVVISNLTATIIPPVVSGITGTTNICAGQSTTLTATNGNSSTQWLSGSCAGPVIGTGASITVSPAVTTTYYISNPAVCGNPSSCISQTVTVSNPPNAGTDGSVSVCENSTTMIDLFSLITGEQAGGVWTRPTGTGGTFNALAGTFTPAAGVTSSTFNYTLTGVAPCVNDVSTVTITIVPPPDAGTNGAITLCSTSAPVNLFSSLGGSPQTTGTWSGGLTGGHLGTYNPATFAPGVYTYTVPGSSGCANATASVTVTENAATTPTFNPVAAICSGDPLAPLPTTSTNGINGTWSPALNNLATTTYTFTPTAGQCATTTTLTINVNSSTTPTFNPVAGICSGDPLAALPTTSTNGINGTWSPALNNLATTTYTFTPTAGQCATTTTLTINVNSSTAPTFNPVAAICSGDPLAPLPTTSTNGINGTWSPALNNLATTTYTFTPTAGQCATTTTLTINVNSSTTPTFNPVAGICSGDPLAALPTTSTNGINGTWSPALNNLATTTYTFTPTAGQCATTTTLTINVNSSTTPTFNPVAGICSGDPLAALPTTSTNGINGTWSPALNNLATTTYTFTPTAGQCATTTTLTINVNSAATPTFNPVAGICSGDPLAALPTTSTNGINGTWSPALNNLATTTYTFTPTAGQCASTTTLTINVNSSTTPTFNPVAAICSGDPLAALPTTSTNGINGTWSPALNNLATTTYTFTPTAGQCATTTTLTINVNSSTTPTFNPVAGICSGDPLAALPTTSTNGINGTWSPALNNLATTTYTFTPTAGQCATTTTLTINVNSSTTPTFNPVAAICSGDPLAPLPTTSTNGINGTWSPALNNLATTTYTFTPTAGQCATTTTLTINVNSSTTPTFNPVAAICSGDPLAALPTISTNGINGTWSPALNNLATTTYTFTPTAGQCATTTTLTINVNSSTTPTFNPVAGICSGDPLAALPTISTNGINGTWSPALNNLATTTYTFTPTAGQCATTTTLTITVNPLPVANFSSDVTSGCAPLEVTFENLSVGSLNCSWDFGDGNSANGCSGISNSYLNSGLFSVSLTVTDVNGCTDQAIFTNYIEVFPDPVAAFTPSTYELDFYEPSVEFSNNSLNAINYVWNFGDGSAESGAENPIHIFPTDAGNTSYTVSLIAYNGACTDTAYAQINLDEIILLYVPNVFTPDGNDLNDFFQPVFTSGFDPYNYHLLIFNRWGELIFESYNAAVGWNGTYGDNGLVLDDVYVWKIDFKETMSDKQHRLIGHVTVLK